VVKDSLLTLQGDAMLHYAVVFLIIALIAAGLDLAESRQAPPGSPRVLFVIFLIGVRRVVPDARSQPRLTRIRPGRSLVASGRQLRR